MYLISIEADKIDQNDLKQTSSGKKFLNLVMTKMQQPDQYGNTHTVYLSQSKEQREQKAPKKYIGKAKEATQNTSNQSSSNNSNSVWP